MIEFSYVPIPIELNNFLKGEISTPKDAAELLSKSFRKNRSLEKTLLHILSEFDSQKRLGSILTSLGLKNFRDRFVSIIIYRWMNGLYPSKSKPELVSDITRFDDVFFNYKLHSNGRVYLLGTYLTMLEILSLHKGASDVEAILINFPRELTELLKEGNGRSSHIDIVILVLWHCYSFWGYEVLKNRWAESPGSYTALISKMSDDQKHLYLKNLLCYAGSIGDESLFFWEQIS